jgi:hypothetical protein
MFIAIRAVWVMRCLPAIDPNYQLAPTMFAAR